MIAGRAWRRAALVLALSSTIIGCDETEIDLSPPHVGNDCECRIRCPTGLECAAFGTTCGADGLCADSPEGGSCLVGLQLECQRLAPTAACVPLRAGAVCPSLEVDASSASAPADERAGP